MSKADVFNTAEELRERGYSKRVAPFNILNYDPAGDGDDHDALVLVSREEWQRGELHDPDLSVEFIYRILMAHRLPKGMEFPDKIATILSINRQMNRWVGRGAAYSHAIGVETNGVGYATASTLRSKTNVPVIPYVTVGMASDKPFANKQVAMPRLASLDNLRVLLELHRVKAVKDCYGIDDLHAELNSFVWAGPKRPEAMTGQHDDLVLALAGAVWIGSKLIPPVTKQVKVDQKRGIRDHLNRKTSGAIRIQ